ncbi:tRNA (adenosine(37)-N6)-threonylcarbamoyltransferase complex ATPase subunit type 1 TsaE [Campylobacter sp. LH-2024]|uniref:tRNA (Adenosine(37)-N6)-threonylcarbamoyltransferase complex ATPase subunit type 1 TsaE n=1 Tax=Campylobacter molothri TaxID=1032242 RepID=A0ACC5W2T9_9BACT|nr:MULTISPECIES: tRNA (adenosine(37)-N6)-threonylcarbamoyltransferase complex ATPase subunit type 1 TsaE [unclassified Campylobacter]MBZ7928834.1 tRNA (adenosine(37)-N6)-threonylcarbamoyltransferase complex ATPase subunit type 1 TsaE [Campylobacter sp. RM10542]MBZ7930209.1 tRNA (adenosine(37)-N6)-threonylcarbamoyltransferase complex ATPase subunit type 1 TsaE [Campylobacter sp. W0067]MBZ7931460.1 tRNA (adenosine(37)-N6)-threonylcarbamoyltransferase complex ATPase subunit type 1 TsaE [Campylobact
MKEIVLSKEEIDQIFSYLPCKGVVLLQGDLASGKTSLVQAWVKFLNLSDQVTSPTFSIMQKYQNENICIYHYDIYQEGLEGLLKNGLFDNLFEEGLHLVEWGDEQLKEKLFQFGILSTVVKISVEKNKRKYEIL